METQVLAEFDLGDAGFEVAPPLKGKPGTLGPGSRNIIAMGRNNRRAWKGLLASEDAGSRVLLNVGGKLGGLGDISGVEAKGSVDVYLRNTIWFIGFGQLFYDGEDIIGSIASTTQKVLVRVNGQFDDPKSGPYDSGLPQPSRPDVFLLDSPVAGKVDGLTSFMIASLRSITGDRSRASEVSISLFGTKSRVGLKFPQAPVGGTGWAVFAPRLGFGGTGVHRRIRNANNALNREYLESDIEREVLDVVTTNASNNISSATAAFSTADIGKHVFLKKGVTEFESTITNIVSATVATLANPVTFTDTGVLGRFTAFAGGQLRAVEINYDDLDLTSEAAWSADFPPLPGVFSFHLVDVRVVCGILSDAESDPTVNDAGTALAVSEKNHPGSFDPLKIVFMPERFVGGIGRPTDRHYFIFGVNWTGAVQYTGADLGPAVSVSTVWANTGFVKQQNVCLSYGRLYGFSSKREAVRMQNAEEPDTTFGSPMQAIFDTWDPAKVVVEETKNAVIYAHEGVEYHFDLQTNQWMPPCYLSDNAPGHIVSAANVGGDLFITMKNGSTFTLYKFDAGTGSTMTAMSNFIGGPSVDRPKQLLEIAETVILDKTDNYYISLHRNVQVASLHGVSISASSGILDVLSPTFDQSFIGKYILVFGAGAAGAPLLARIGSVVTSTRIELADAARPFNPVLGALAVTTVTNGHAIVGDLIFPRTGKIGALHRLGKRINIPNCYSYAVGVSIVSTGASAQAAKVTLRGVVKQGRGGKP